MRIIQTRSLTLAAAFCTLSFPALATGASPMEGTWGGADAQGRTAQITIVGDKIIGVFWGSDYHDAENVRASHGGAGLDFTIDGDQAVFTHDPQRGRITVRDKSGRAITIELKKD